MQFNPLEGKVALVTGASQGIGSATAHALANAGAAILVSDVAGQQAAGEELVAEIQDYGGTAAFRVCDVGDETDVKGLVEFACQKYGHLDIACNNAGYSAPPARLADIDNGAWDQVMSINLRGVWWCMKHEIQQFLRQGSGGSIVNLSSLAGLVGLAGQAAYAASKHGIIGLTKSAAIDYAADGIRVNAVCPGLVITKMVRNFLGDDPAVHQQAAAAAPMGRAGTPEEIASAVLWLAGPGASFTTGLAMSVDGGWVAR